MPSFDVVSEVNMQEVDNAINQAVKEIVQRYDFKGSKASIEWKQKDKQIVLSAEDEYKIGAAKDILLSKLLKRSVPIKNLKYEDAQPASGSMLKQVITVQTGLDKDHAKKVSQVIKDAKLKVQAQIMDDQVRVTGKNIDDLQLTIQKLRTSEIGVDVQFVNMRS